MTSDQGLPFVFCILEILPELLSERLFEQQLTFDLGRVQSLQVSQGGSIHN
jgi:hypothetical protein